MGWSCKQNGMELRTKLDGVANKMSWSCDKIRWSCEQNEIELRTKCDGVANKMRWSCEQNE